MMKRTYRTILTVAALIGAALVPKSVSGETAVQRHGELHTDGKYILNKNNRIVQLRGMSFYWSTKSWNGAKYYTADAVNKLVDTYKCTVVRAAYDPGDNWDGVQTVINAAIKKGIYVVIDWHSHNAENQASQAIQFFKEQAGKYKNTPNVIFEPYNEPITTNGDKKDGTQSTAVVTWGKIKPYLQNVTQAIRDAGAKNLVVVGTPYYCQFVNVAAGDQLKDKSGKPFENLAYSFHFYAASHGRESMYVKAGQSGGMEPEYLQGALGKIPLFITEWGTTHSDGSQQVDATNTAWWFNKYVNGDYRLSHCNWSVSSFEGSSAFTEGLGGLTSSGKVAMKWINGGVDEFKLPSEDGLDGPLAGKTVTMPINHPAKSYMKYWGGNISTVNTAVPFNSRDKDDVRKAANTCIPVLSGASGDDWVLYDFNNSTATKYLQIRYRPTNDNGEGTIDVQVDEKSIGKIAVKGKGWQTAKFDTNIGSGKHAVKLVFTVSKGDGYLIEWIELTNTATSVLFDKVYDVKPQMSNAVTLVPAIGGFSLVLPQYHGFTGYKLLKADGRTAQSGSITSSAINFTNLNKGVWFVELNGSTGKKQVRTVVCNQ